MMTELFPTDLRGDAFAWANNFLGRIGYVLSPIALGWIAESSGWGPVLAWTANDPATVRRLVAVGVDGIASDDPGMVVETLATLLAQ